MPTADIRVIWSGNAKAATAAQRRLRNSIRETERQYKTAAAGARLFGTAAIGIGGLAIAAHRKQEQAELQLAAAIKNRNLQTSISVGFVKELAHEMQRTTKFGDELSLAVAGLGLRLGNLNKQQLQPFLQLTADFATARGKDMIEAGRQMAIIMADARAGVGRLIESGIVLMQHQKDEVIALADAGREIEAKNKLMEHLANKYRGAAAATLEGTGALERLKNEAGDVAEVVGKELWSSLSSVVNGLSDFLFGLKSNDAAIRQIAEGIKTAARIAATLGIAMVALKIKLWATTAAMHAVGIAAKGAAIAMRAFWAATGLGVAFLAAGYLPQIAKWLIGMGKADSKAMSKARADAKSAADNWQAVNGEMDGARKKVQALRDALSRADGDQRNVIAEQLREQEGVLDNLISKEQQLARAKLLTAEIAKQQARLEKAQAATAKWRATKTGGVFGMRADYVKATINKHARDAFDAAERLDLARAELAGINADRVVADVAATSGGGDADDDVVAEGKVLSPRRVKTRRNAAHTADRWAADRRQDDMRAAKFDEFADDAGARRSDMASGDDAEQREYDAKRERDELRRFAEVELQVQYNEEDLALYRELLAERQALEENDRRARVRREADERNKYLLDIKNHGKAIAAVNKFFRAAEVKVADKAAAKLVALENDKSSKLRAIGRAARAYQKARLIAEVVANMAAGIAGSFANAARAYIPPKSIAMGALGAAKVVATNLPQLASLRSAERGGIVSGLRAAGDTQGYNLTAGEVVVPERDFDTVKRGIINNAANDNDDDDAGGAREVKVRIEFDGDAGRVLRADIAREGVLGT